MPSGNPTARRFGNVAQMYCRDGRTFVPEYKVWRSVRRRCLNPSTPNYARYGGRGITICDRWRDDFGAFYEDMGPRPTPDHQIERIDNDGAYSPENCVWATRGDQASNRRNNRHLAFDGEVRTLSEWARLIEQPVWLLKQRIDRDGWTLERALTTPRRASRWV